MKNIIYICVLFVVFATACENEIVEPVKDEVVNIDGTHIQIDELIKYVPEEYFDSGVQVVFKNESNSEFVMDVEASKKNTYNYSTSDGEYSVEQQGIILSSKLFSYFSINIGIVGNFDSKQKKISKKIIIDMASNSEVMMGTNLRFKNGMPDKSYLWKDNIKLNSQIFENVFYGENLNQASFSAIYFSPKIGVVGFRDANNELWVYSEIRK